MAHQQSDRIQFPPIAGIPGPTIGPLQRVFAMTVTTVVLIPGLWMTALAWEHWIKHYSEKGYRVIAANWPGMNGDVEQLRRDPNSFAGLGIAEVVDHYEQIIRELEIPPIIIGHGLGGLITQVLLDRGWGAAGVAIASVPPTDVSRSVFGNLRLVLKGRSLTPQQFHRDFVNTISDASAIAAFERYVVPAPKRVLRQLAFADFASNAPGTVRFHNNSRAPLLLVAGGKDRIARAPAVKANFDSYRQSKAETDHKEYPDQDHFGFLIETRVADYVLGWALCRANGSKLTAIPSQTDTWSVQL